MNGACESILERGTERLLTSKYFRLITVILMKVESDLLSTRVATRVTLVPYLGWEFFDFKGGENLVFMMSNNKK